MNTSRISLQPMTDETWHKIPQISYLSSEMSLKYVLHAFPKFSCGIKLQLASVAVGLVTPFSGCLPFSMSLPYLPCRWPRHLPNKLPALEYCLQLLREPILRHCLPGRYRDWSGIEGKVDTWVGWGAICLSI